MISMPDQRGIDGLLRRGCIKSVAESVVTGGIFFALTPFGYALAADVDATLKRVSPNAPQVPAGKLEVFGEDVGRRHNPSREASRRNSRRTGERLPGKG
jgi:hypothetical protein